MATCLGDGQNHLRTVDTNQFFQLILQALIPFSGHGNRLGHLFSFLIYRKISGRVAPPEWCHI
jgi:hypothetical protein